MKDKLRNQLSWAGIVLLGLVNGILEDLMYISILVPYTPISVDLTGDMFWVFTVPLAQLMALAVTGTAAWFLGIKQFPRLIVFWGCWVAARTAFLSAVLNPVEDILIYILWITLWCGLIGLAGHFKRDQAT